MTAHPARSEFEIRSNAAYAALMWALSRPGLPGRLPAPGQVSIVEALIDRECVVHCQDPALAALAARTGAQLVPPGAADHVFLDTLATSDLLRILRLGSDLHPEDGATLVVNAELGRGQALRLCGPGVDRAIEIRIGGLPGDFWAVRDRVMGYPVGFELFLVDGDRILGLARSTSVEVL